MECRHRRSGRRHRQCTARATGAGKQQQQQHSCLLRYRDWSVRAYAKPSQCVADLTNLAANLPLAVMQLDRHFLTDIDALPPSQARTNSPADPTNRCATNLVDAPVYGNYLTN